MAGAIQKMVSAVNRTTEPVDGMFDGQPVVLLPGYEIVDGKVVGAGPSGTVRSNPLPYFAAEMIKRQNPVMGTEDPLDPRDFESLIGIVEWDDPIDHLEQSDAIERLDRELMSEEAQTATPMLTAAGRKSKKKTRGGRRYSDTRLKNPLAIRADYEG